MQRTPASILATAALLGGLLISTASAPIASGGGASTGTLYFSRDSENELYVIDTTDGSATLVGTTGTTSATVGLTEGPDEGVLIGSTWTDLSRINADGSGFTAAGTADLRAEGLAYDPDGGVLYRALNGEFTTADLTTGAPGPVDLDQPGEDIEGLAWRDTGEIYGVSRDSSTLFAYDIAGDSWSVVGDTEIANNDDYGLAWDPIGDVLYAVNVLGDVYRIDPDTADAILVGNTGVSGSGGGLAFVAGAPPEVALVAGTPVGAAGGEVTFPVAGVCGDAAGNEVSLTITGPGGASAGPVEVVTGDDGGYEASLVVDPAPAGDYTVTGTCTIGGTALDLPDATVVLGAVVAPTPGSQGPTAAPATPRFTG